MQLHTYFQRPIQTSRHSSAKLVQLHLTLRLSIAKFSIRSGSNLWSCSWGGRRDQALCPKRISKVLHPFGCGSVWGWGNDAINVSSTLSKKVATQICRPLNEVVSTIYVPLSLTLIRLFTGHIPHWVPPDVSGPSHHLLATWNCDRSRRRPWRSQGGTENQEATCRDETDSKIALFAMVMNTSRSELKRCLLSFYDNLFCRWQEAYYYYIN